MLRLSIVSGLPLNKENNDISEVSELEYLSSLARSIISLIKSSLLIAVGLVVDALVVKLVIIVALLHNKF